MSSFERRLFTTITEAIFQRISELCIATNQTPEHFFAGTNITPLLIRSLSEKTGCNPGIVMIILLCGGFDITIRDFFNSYLFDDLEQEVK